MAVPARRSAAPDAHGASGVRTFLIADIRGYTRFTQERGDAAAARLAERFAGLAREAVAARGGDVVELRGDEALAVFGSARQAIRAAVELQAAFAEERATDPTLPAGMGIGLDAGEAIPVEDGFRGAALNLAARLCASAGPGETLASDGVVHLARAIDGIRFEDSRTESFKGIDEPVRYVRVVGALEPLPPIAVGAPVGPTGELPPGLDATSVPLVGRERELWWLRGSWRLARRGHGRLLAVSGPAGIGRTRLAAELARIVGDDGASVRYLRLEQDPGALGGLPAELTPAGPTLVVIDDLDLAEPVALARLGALVDGIAAPVLVVATARDDVANPALAELLARLDAVDAHVALGPVDADAVLAIVGVYSARPSTEVPVTAILEASDGVPATVHALAADWARSEASRRLGSAATRASTGRRELRAIEAELADNVIDLQQIRERSRRLSAAAVAGESVCPFKGLAAFEAADVDLFFGRERLVAELVARLVGATFLGIVGPSGSGKSSALRAGLLPALASGVLPGSEGWRQVLFRPGAGPMDALRRAVGAGADDDPVATALAGLPPGGRVLVAVDQFEEVFTSCDDEAARTEFLDTLVRFADDPDRRAKVVVALRADFYGRYAAHPAIAELLGTGHVLVGPMQADEFRRAIELPAERAGLRVEPELVDALVTDVLDEPGALPLLSTALLELWTRRDGRTLRLASYEQTGGVRGAVARMAEEAYGGLPSHEQPVARAVLLRLASEEDGRTIAPRRAPLSEFDVHDAAVADVISSLTARRLLTVDEGSLEVAHDALLREWPRLASWLDEDAQGRTLRRHLTATASEWMASGREPGELYRGARLASALDWTAEHDVELNALEREFLAASRGASEAEALRIRRTNRRLRILLGAVGAALAIAVVAGGIAVVQQREAERSAAAAEEQRSEAEAQRAVAEAQKAEAERAALVADAQRLGAQALTEDRLDRSLLLARLAVALDDSLETQSSLLAAVEKAPAAISVLHTDEPVEWVDTPPDGSVVIAQTNTGRALFWDTTSGRLLDSGVALGAGLFGHDIDPAGTTLAAVSAGNPSNGDTIYVYLVGLASQPYFIEKTVQALDALGPVVFTADGGAIVTLELDRADPSRSFLVFRDGTTAQPTGRAITVRGGDGDAVLASVDTGRIAYSFRPADGGPGFTQVIDLASGGVEIEVPVSGPLAVSPDARFVAIGREDGAVELVDLTTGRSRLSSGGHQGMVTGVVFSPDGSTLLSTGLDRDAIVWDASRLVAREVLRGHSGPVLGPVVSPDGATAWTGSGDATVIAWDLAGTRRLIEPFSLRSRAEPTAVHLATVAGDDRTLVFALPDGRVRLHDLTGQRADRDIAIWDSAAIDAIYASYDEGRPRPTGEIHGLASQPGGSLVAITSDLPVPVLLDVDTGRIRELTGGHPPGFTWAATFSADGHRLATGGEDASVAIWDVATGVPTILPRFGTGIASALAFDPSGAILAVALTWGNPTGDVVLWDIATGRPALDHSLNVDLWAVLSLDFTSDGQRLVGTGQQSGDVTVWDVAAGRAIRTTSAHAGAALDAIVDPADRLIVSAGSDGVARLWDLASGQAIGTPLIVRQGELAESSVAVALIHDGKDVVVVNDRGEGAIWPLDEARWGEQACAVAGRTLTTQELETYLPGREAPPICTP